LRVLNKKQIVLLLLVFFLISVFLTPQFQSYYFLQERQRFIVGEPLELLHNLPPIMQKVINVYVREGNSFLFFEGQESRNSNYFLGVNAPVGVKPGNVSLELRLFGLIPLKRINVDVVPDIRLIPGGHSIGVLLRTEGVLVIGYSPVLKQNNEVSFPAREADIRVGDVIISINGEKIVSDDQAGKIIAENPNPQQGIKITIARDGKLLQRVVYPQLCEDTKTYRIGLFIRDNAGGVGTLTFADPVSKKFGALGHVITDSETNQKLQIQEGKILAVSVENIEKGKPGTPGEKMGIFLENSEFGDIEKNEMCGIYGTLNRELSNEHYAHPLPVVFANQLSPGKAQILTVVNGQQIKKYDIEIEKILLGRRDGKNMIIRITDPELLQATGGIVQGMSGSPIIQDGKLAGAVTHVFVNDPTRGYGVFIENMLFEAEIINENKQILGLRPQDLFFKYSHEKKKTSRNRWYIAEI
jgi:stage IV sporulation protein B